MSDHGAVTDEPTDTEAHAPAGARSPKIALFAAVAALAIAADALTKALVVSNLQEGHPKKLLGGAVYLLLTRNSGAAFSLGTSFTVLLTAVAVVVAAVIIRTARRLYSSGWAVAFALVLGGAVGNLIDRFLRAPGPGRGHVVDFVSLFSRDGTGWPVFNVADSCICCGAVLAGLLALRGINFDGSRGEREAAGDGA